VFGLSQWLQNLRGLVCACPFSQNRFPLLRDMR
jgi:hypothetical protein